MAVLSGLNDRQVLFFNEITSRMPSKPAEGLALLMGELGRILGQTLAMERLSELPAHGVYDAVVVAVGHREFVEMGVAGVQALGKDGAVLYDVKGIFGKDETAGRL